MRLFKKKAHPIEARARALEREIASLESEIKQLTLRAEQGPAPAPPHAKPAAPAPANGHNAAPSARTMPVFEPVDQQRVKQPAEKAPTPELVNELGVHRYDLAGAWQRLKDQFREPPAAHNARLINYLAAGSIQGLRPLRYEKRVARNRLILLVAIFFVVLWGIFYVFIRNH